jgi:hypothetical protein
MVVPLQGREDFSAAGWETRLMAVWVDGIEERCLR